MSYFASAAAATFTAAPSLPGAASATRGISASHHSTSKWTCFSRYSYNDFPQQRFIVTACPAEELQDEGLQHNTLKSQKLTYCT